MAKKRVIPSGQNHGDGVPFSPFTLVKSKAMMAKRDNGEKRRWCKRDGAKMTVQKRRCKRDDGKKRRRCKRDGAKETVQKRRRRKRGQQKAATVQKRVIPSGQNHGDGVPQ
jgi:hypothetical protein